LNKIRIITVNRIAPNVCIEEHGTAEQKLSKYERTEEQEGKSSEEGDERPGRIFPGNRDGGFAAP
jgi:hypothetical protein